MQVNLISISSETYPISIKRKKGEKIIKFILLHRMTESLSKKRGARNVYIRHIENLENEIKETIVNFDINNSRHRKRFKVKL